MKDFSMHWFVEVHYSKDPDRSDFEDFGRTKAMFSDDSELHVLRSMLQEHWWTKRKRSIVHIERTWEEITSRLSNEESETSRLFSWTNFWTSSDRIEDKGFESMRSVCNRVRYPRAKPMLWISLYCNWRICNWVKLGMKKTALIDVERSGKNIVFGINQCNRRRKISPSSVLRRRFDRID